MAHTFTSLLTHVIFSTLGRAPLIADAIRTDLHAYLGGILGELRATPIVIGGTADHVHVLLQAPADLAVADCLRVLKTNSSRRGLPTFDNRSVGSNKGQGWGRSFCPLRGLGLSRPAGPGEQHRKLFAALRARHGWKLGVRHPQCFVYPVRPAAKERRSRRGRFFARRAGNSAACETVTRCSAMAQTDFSEVIQSRWSKRARFSGRE